MIPKLSQKFGKRTIILLSVAYNFVFSVCLFLFPIANPYVYMVLATVANAGQTAFMMLIWSFVTDCIDYQEFKTNQRADGTLYSIYTFSRKIAASLTHSGATYLLALVGFVSGAQMQAAGVGEGIRNVATLMPAIACVVEVLGIGLIYNLNKKKTDEIYEELQRRYAEENK